MQLVDPDRIKRAKDASGFERMMGTEEVIEQALRDMGVALVVRVDSLNVGEAGPEEKFTSFPVILRDTLEGLVWIGLNDSEALLQVAARVFPKLAGQECLDRGQSALLSNEQLK